MPYRARPRIHSITTRRRPAASTLSTDEYPRPHRHLVAANGVRLSTGPAAGDGVGGRRSPRFALAAGVLRRLRRRILRHTSAPHRRPLAGFRTSDHRGGCSERPARLRTDIAGGRTQPAGQRHPQYRDR